MKERTISYVYDSLQEAVKAYHMCLSRLEKWEHKYSQYRFEINLLTSGIKRSPSVKITIRNVQAFKSKKVKGDS